MPDLTYKQNDYGFKIAATLHRKLADGTLTPLVLVSGDVVKFLLREEESLTSVLEVTATKDVLSPAAVSYTFVAGNLAIPGTYRGEWEVTFVAGGVQTYPSDGYHSIVVLKDLGPGA